MSKERRVADGVEQHESEARRGSIARVVMALNVEIAAGPPAPIATYELMRGSLEDLAADRHATPMGSAGASSGPSACFEQDSIARIIGVLDRELATADVGLTIIYGGVKHTLVRILRGAVWPPHDDWVCIDVPAEHVERLSMALTTEADTYEGCALDSRCRGSDVDADLRTVALARAMESEVSNRHTISGPRDELARIFMSVLGEDSHEGKPGEAADYLAVTSALRALGVDQPRRTEP